MSNTYLMTGLAGGKSYYRISFASSMVAVRFWATGGSGKTLVIVLFATARLGAF